jgi:hypothetical protein
MLILCLPAVVNDYQLMVALAVVPSTLDANVGQAVNVEVREAIHET